MTQVNDVRFLVFAEDVNALNIIDEDKMILRKRLANQKTFGCTPKPQFAQEDYAIDIFLVLIAKEFRTEQQIIRKLEYTVVHELIHLLGEIDDENLAHSATMIICDDHESNRSDLGYYSIPFEESKVIVQL